MKLIMNSSWLEAKKKMFCEPSFWSGHYLQIQYQKIMRKEYLFNSKFTIYYLDFSCI